MITYHIIDNKYIEKLKKEKMIVGEDDIGYIYNQKFLLKFFNSLAVSSIPKFLTEGKSFVSGNNLMSTTYKTTKLCNFRVENDDGTFYGEVIAINFKGDDPFPFDGYWVYNNKKYYIFAITDDGSMCGHYLPKNLDYKNPYEYSFIIPPCEENAELNEEIMKECFYDEYEEHTDDFDEPVGDIYMDFYDFDLSNLNKNETCFEDIEL